MRTHLFPKVAAVMALSLLLAACGGNTGALSAADLAATQQSLQATQQALNNASPAVANTAEPTDQQPTAEASQATEAPATEAEAYYTEEFDTSPSNWTYELLKGDERDFDLYTENGRLVFDITGPNVWSYLTYDSYTYTDVRVDTTGENFGNNNNNVSLICRYNDRGWYEFNVANNGLYWIFRYDRDTDEFNMLYNGGVQNLRTGKDTNDYTIICDGNRLTLGVNGKEIRTVEDNQFDEGLIGVSVSSFDDYPVRVEFDFVTISTP